MVTPGFRLRMVAPEPCFESSVSSCYAIIRVHMCMLYQCSITEGREQYTALGKVKEEADWCRQGGAPEAYALAAKVFETIDDDVNRTNVGDSDERERVRRVLKAFALKNPKTGYCQVTKPLAL